MLRFYGTVRTGNFVVVHNVLTEGVFGVELCSDAGNLSSTNCLGYQ